MTTPKTRRLGPGRYMTACQGWELYRRSDGAGWELHRCVATSIQTEPAGWEFIDTYPSKKAALRRVSQATPSEVSKSR